MCKKTVSNILAKLREKEIEVYLKDVDFVHKEAYLSYHTSTKKSFIIKVLMSKKYISLIEKLDEVDCDRDKAREIEIQLINLQEDFLENIDLPEEYYQSVLDCISCP